MTEEKETYRIRLSNFEGPLDLLLFLIRKEEMDIYDIPIAVITRQYMEYVELMKELDLEIAGEFILMAATLMQIKVKMLLPKPEIEGEEDFEEDPRAELVRQLLEYKRYKEVAESLADFEDRQNRLFPRTYFDWQKDFRKEEKEVVLKETTLFELMVAFKTVLDNAPEDTQHQVQTIQITVEEQIEYLLEQVDKNEHVIFTELMRQMKERVQIIVTFIAILELIKLRRIVIRQSATFEDIWIMKR